MQMGFSEELEMDLLATKVELAAWNSREEVRLAQQAKQKWLDKGEADSTFFRIMALKNSKTIKEMRINEGNILRMPEEIHCGVVEYFQNFLSSNHQTLLLDLRPWWIQ